MLRITPCKMGKFYGDHLYVYVLTLAMLCFSGTCMASSLKHSRLTNVTDQSALLSLKESITADPHGILNDSWKSETSVCNWFGVSCGLRHQRVIALNLHGLDLVGEIPPSIGNLSFLRFLNISFNNFHGRLPSELGNLRRLKVMDMGVNDMNGEIPQSLGMLRHLQYLDLMNNSLTGKIPLGTFSISSLQVMELGGNSLIGNLPDDLCNHLTSIEHISLGRNFLTGRIPLNLGNCRNLQVLRLEYNNLTGNIPTSIGELPLLEVLGLYGNQLTGSIPPTLFNVSSLRLMSLAFNGLTGELPNEICQNLPEITMISVSFNQLSGLLPSNLSSCQKLQIMSLSYNAFNGVIPEGIGMLPVIEQLYLGFNYLTGTLPHSLSNLTSLKIIAFQKNNVSGSLPRELSGLSSLTVFQAANNTLGGITESFCNLSNLEFFNIQGNSLYGSIPKCIGDLQNLKILYLDANSLSGTIPQPLFNLSMLQELQLSFNHLSGALPNRLGDFLPNIQMLNIGSNELTGSIPSSISNATTLSALDLTSNRLFGQVPTTLGKLHELEIIHLADNHLTTESTTIGFDFLTSLANLRRLRHLRLSSNPLKLQLSSALGNLSDFLEDISMFSCEIHGRIPDEIGNLTRLLELDFTNNALTGLIPSTLGRLPKIQQLYLAHNRLQGPIQVGLCQATSLGNLDLSTNQLSGIIPNCFGNMTSLRYISFRRNKFSSKVPAELCNLRNLFHLDVAYNRLLGSLPLDIGNLELATFIDLSFNRLSGGIPSTIGGLQELSEFNLSGNKMYGSIPSTLGKLKSLESFDLSRNEFSGTIPKDLEELPYLRNFNVSFNRLEGEIPNRGSFEKFSASSFMGNPKLCGPNRFNVPPCKKVSNMKPQNRGLILKIVLPVVTVGILSLVLVLFLTRQKSKGDINIPERDGSYIIKGRRRISYFELVAATNQFSESNLIGVGGFGSVYRARLSDGMEVAVKVFNLHLQEAFRSFDVECEILKNIKHRNLVKIISSCSNNLDFKALVFKYMPNGSLDKWLHSSHQRLSFAQRLNLMVDVASAIEYLHHGYSVPVVHRDLKPSNVLLDDDMVAHVSDFGLSRLLDEGQSTILSNNLATIGYMAPEYGSGGLVSTKADIYSYGILLMETFTGKKPTDTMFETNRSLKEWVYNECCARDTLMNLVDPKLLNEDGSEFSSSKEQCFGLVLELALSCTAEMPHDRNNMIEVVAKLKKIKKQFQQSNQRAIFRRR